MTIDIIRKANQALIQGKNIKSYDLPKSVKDKIANTIYTREQINNAYAKAVNME